MSDHTPAELETEFWKHLRSDMTVMLGLPGKLAGRPMTAQLEDKADRGPIWFFTATDTDIAGKLSPAGDHAELALVAKNHALFATVHGQLFRDDDRRVIDALWNRYVAAWFEGGKEDPKLALLRFDPAEAQIWLDASSLVAGLKLMLGAGDPKEDYADNVTRVQLR
jgi:general stress protein 26